MAKTVAKNFLNQVLKELSRVADLLVCSPDYIQVLLLQDKYMDSNFLFNINLKKMNIYFKLKVFGKT